MLVGLRVTIVSGLAAGIDAISHRTAIKMKGQTIAVIGTPLNKRYPQSNTGLQNEIAAKHLVVSQFPIGHPITKGNFVRRNKTMALISDATVIVEAGRWQRSHSPGVGDSQTWKAAVCVPHCCQNPSKMAR